MKKFGLIGKTLSHSYSREYFTKKFDSLKLHDHSYELFEIAHIDLAKKIFETPHLVGLNVTVPYKQSIIPYLNHLDTSATRVGAVNVIKIDQDKNLTGYNSDYLGFKHSLEKWYPYDFSKTALVLGSGGAAKAVVAALEDLGFTYRIISRTPNDEQLGYNKVDEKLLEESKLIINTTPLGMSPNEKTFPPINYKWINSNHYLYDLVYNPELTEFLSRGQKQQANIKNGLEMLHLQAEESWKIWNSV